MNKLKKIGLTALAGSLVASSVYAGTLDVTGSWSLSYNSEDDDEVTGNGWSMGDSVTFSGSGETDQGYAIGVSYELDGGTFDDYKLTMDMQDAGKITFSGASVGSSGLKAYSDKVPNANEAVYGSMDSSNDNGIVGGGSTSGSWGYDGTFGGIGISAYYAPEGKDGSTTGSDSSIVVTYADLIDGLEVGAGTGEKGETQDEETFYAKYVYGNLTIGWQRSNIDFAAAGTGDEESTHLGVSLAVNDDLSISTGRLEVDMGAGKVDEVSTGISASYTMGSMTVSGFGNKTDDGDGTSGKNDSSKGMSISFAF